jgi:hypothetical protein
MRQSFFQILHDETLRTELGPAVVADLAVENLELSSPGAARSSNGAPETFPAGVTG